MLRVTPCHIKRMYRVMCVIADQFPCHGNRYIFLLFFLVDLLKFISGFNRILS